MIEHVVLFRFRAETPAERLEEMQRAIAVLADRIPGIRSIHFGPNLSDRSGGYGHVLASRFDTSADLQAYIDHPEHQAVVRDLFRPQLESLIVADVELPESP